jgi:hypothetical protein
MDDVVRSAASVEEEYKEVMSHHCACSPTKRDHCIACDRVVTEGLSAGGLWTLRPLTWLNDEVINAYNAHLLKDFPCVYIFSTLFMELLRTGGPTTQSMKKWAKRVDLVSKSLVVFPCNKNRSHWSFILADLHTGQIKYLDSLAGDYNGTEEVADVVKYLHTQFYSKRSDQRKAAGAGPGAAATIAVKQWEVVKAAKWSSPQQGTNMTECGVMMLLGIWCSLLKQGFDFALHNTGAMRQHIYAKLRGGLNLNHDGMSMDAKVDRSEAGKMKRKLKKAKDEEKAQQEKEVVEHQQQEDASAAAIMAAAMESVDLKFAAPVRRWVERLVIIQCELVPGAKHEHVRNVAYWAVSLKSRECRVLLGPEYTSSVLDGYFATTALSLYWNERTWLEGKRVFERQVQDRGLDLKGPPLPQESKTTNGRPSPIPA